MRTQLKLQSSLLRRLWIKVEMFHFFSFFSFWTHFSTTTFIFLYMNTLQYFAYIVISAVFTSKPEHVLLAERWCHSVLTMSMKNPVSLCKQLLLVEGRKNSYCLFFTLHSKEITLYITMHLTHHLRGKAFKVFPSRAYKLHFNWRYWYKALLFCWKHIMSLHR
jgi:hypothetical protein